jgi:hypothetical protein
VPQIATEMQILCRATMARCAQSSLNCRQAWEPAGESLGEEQETTEGTNKNSRQFSFLSCLSEAITDKT